MKCPVFSGLSCYLHCPGLIINSALFIHKKKCSLDDKLYGHLTHDPSHMLVVWLEDTSEPVTDPARPGIRGLKGRPFSP